MQYSRPGGECDRALCARSESEWKRRKENVAVVFFSLSLLSPPFFDSLSRKAPLARAQLWLSLSTRDSRRSQEAGVGGTVVAGTYRGAGEGRRARAGKGDDEDDFFLFFFFVVELLFPFFFFFFRRRVGRKR